MGMKLLLLLVGVAFVYAQVPNCCAPTQWMSQAIESNALGVVSHKIWFDAERLLVRWDKRGNLEERGVITEQISWINYTTTPVPFQYVYDPATKKCILDGADAFYRWCYGTDRSQEYESEININGAAATVWQNVENGFKWMSSNKDCLPLSLQHDADATFMLFTNTTTSLPDPSTWFNVPAVCKQSFLSKRDIPASARLHFP